MSVVKKRTTSAKVKISISSNGVGQVQWHLQKETNHVPEAELPQMKIPADEPPAGTNRAAQPPKPRAKAPRECRKGVQEVVKASEVQRSHVQGKRALVDGRPQADARTAPKKSQVSESGAHATLPLILKKLAATSIVKHAWTYYTY